MPAKKQTRKRAKKITAKKAATAFDQALLPPSQQGVPTLEDNFDVDSFDENAPPDLSKVEVNVVGGDSVSLEESDKSLFGGDQYKEESLKAFKEATFEFPGISIDMKDSERIDMLRDLIANKWPLSDEGRGHIQKMSKQVREEWDKFITPILDKTSQEVTAKAQKELDEIQIAPITLPKAEATPPVDNVPEKPVKAPVAVRQDKETPFTWNEASIIVISLIDGLNYLHPHAKRRIKGKDTPILMERVARGRKLAAQMKSYASEKES